MPNPDILTPSSPSISSNEYILTLSWSSNWTSKEPSITWDKSYEVNDLEPSKFSLDTSTFFIYVLGRISFAAYIIKSFKFENLSNG